MPVRQCLHCGKRGAHTRPRRLCSGCYYNTAVRDLYPVRRGNGVHGSSYKLPEAPTRAAPGSEEKVQTLEERARQGVALFHPRDARINVA